MADLDKDRPTEIELELDQKERLLDLFRLVKTYDEREAVIDFCKRFVTGYWER